MGVSFGWFGCWCGLSFVAVRLRRPGGAGRTLVGLSCSCGRADCLGPGIGEGLTDATFCACLRLYPYIQCYTSMVWGVHGFVVVLFTSVRGVPDALIP